jgi:uncharacterized protein YcbX
MPTVARLFIHPIKSLDRVSVAEASILAGGSFAHDREFALFDPAGDFINGKREPRLHRVRAEYDLKNFTVSLSDNGNRAAAALHLLDDQKSIEEWFCDFLGGKVEMKRNVASGFPDDTRSPGPTIISVATLDEVSSWFPDLDREQAGRRFRANIEIADVPQFWEDCLFSARGEPVGFSIGAVTLDGINPCQRCVVPSRDPNTGQIVHGFQKIFSENRKRTLPPWTPSARFDHFYRLSINSRIAPSQTGKCIRVGDELKV